MESLYHNDKLTVIIKPTNQCNSRCVYCSASTGHPIKKMTIATLERLFERLAEYTNVASFKRLDLTWHGGEPLLMGPDFYESIIPLQSLLPDDLKVSHNMQSNITLFNEAFIPAFNELKVHISSSIDPVPGARLLADGNDPLNIWFDRAKTVLEHFNHLGLICVLRRQHLDNTLEIFTFFQNLYALTNGRIGLRFNPLYFGGRSRRNNTYPQIGLSTKAYADVMLALWRLWIQGGRYMNIQPFVQWAHMLQTHQPSRSCEHCDNCANGWLGVDPDGDVYNCGRHIDSGELPFGNLHDNPLGDIVHHPDRQKLYQRAENLAQAQCRDCFVWDFCHGGCPDDAFLYSGDRMNKTHWCEGLKTIYRDLLTNERNFHHLHH